MGRSYTERELKEILEILDTARVTEYAQIYVKGFSTVQLNKALKALKHLAAREWYVKAQGGRL